MFGLHIGIKQFAERDRQKCCELIALKTSSEIQIIESKKTKQKQIKVVRRKGLFISYGCVSRNFMQSAKSRQCLLDIWANPIPKLFITQCEELRNLLKYNSSLI